MTGALGLTAEEVAEVLGAAVLAPSVHNTQPWRFRLLPDRIELHPDPDRVLPATDPEGRELRLSCGAALFNLRLALLGLGVRPLVTLVPGDDAPGALAVVRRGGRRAPDDDTRRLLDAVPLRRTNRLPFAPGGVPVDQRRALLRAAERERAWLHLVGPTEIDRVRELAVKAHRLQLEDAEVRGELSEWSATRPCGDGVPHASAGLRPAPDDGWPMRDFRGAERAADEAYEPDPLVAVLCSFYEGPAAELQSGQALQRVLLTATALGLAASFLSQVIEVRPVREELRRSLGGTLVPQTVLRLGVGATVPERPRRDVADLVLPVGQRVPKFWVQ
ncbi:nitroreductase family protein [Saccharothrix violaceirubra]|uniref:Nitroreductase n=1 Tax=Saccharothrix violaceirubra TaxID=413306 RepID=A0A7W7T5J0_9PSEU|nr:nitroreductase [Saccharothrix violaceirubra]